VRYNQIKYVDQNSEAPIDGSAVSGQSSSAIQSEPRSVSADPFGQWGSQPIGSPPGMRDPFMVLVLVSDSGQKTRLFLYRPANIKIILYEATATYVKVM